MVEHAAEPQPLPLLLSDSGLLVHGEHRVRLAGTDTALVRRLLERHPAPLDPRELPQVLWPDSKPSDLALRRRLARIRRQLFDVGLVLRHRQRVGYTLEPSPIAARYRSFGTAGEA
jgi:DNA-binding winged helix-turn-helix (wHTH) protein